MMNKLTVTVHAMRRACERMLNISLKGTDKQCFEKNTKLFKQIEEYLSKAIMPYQASLIEGTVYHAQIEGFDEYRARIKVQNGVHNVITIIGLDSKGTVHNKEYEKKRRKKK